MQNEIWKDCKGYEGRYQISNLGRVKSLEKIRTAFNKITYIQKEKILKGMIDKDGYAIVKLRTKDGKSKLEKVHRLVAIAFIPNPENKPQVNHKDENKQNNHVENLEWCDAKYNNNYGSHLKNQSAVQTNNSKKSIKVVCVETGIIYPSMKEAQRQTGIFDSSISKVCRHQQETARGYHWEYYKEYNVRDVET